MSGIRDFCENAAESALKIRLSRIITIALASAFAGALIIATPGTSHACSGCTSGSDHGKGGKGGRGGGGKGGRDHGKSQASGFGGHSDGFGKGRSGSGKGHTGGFSRGGGKGQAGGYGRDRSRDRDRNGPGFGKDRGKGHAVGYGRDRNRDRDRDRNRHGYGKGHGKGYAGGYGKGHGKKSKGRGRGKNYGGGYSYGGGDGQGYFERTQRRAYWLYGGKKYRYARKARYRTHREVVYVRPVYAKVIRPRHLRDNRPSYRTIYAVRGARYPTVVHTAPVYDYAETVSAPLYSREIVGYAPVRGAVKVHSAVRASADYGRAAITTRQVIKRRGRVTRVRTVTAYAEGYGARVSATRTVRRAGARVTGGVSGYGYDGNTIYYAPDRHEGDAVYKLRKARMAPRKRWVHSYTDMGVQDVYSLPGHTPASRGRVRCIDASGCY